MVILLKMSMHYNRATFMYSTQRNTSIFMRNFFIDISNLPPFIPGTFLSCCFDWVNYIIFNERTVLNIYEEAVILCSKNAFTTTSNVDFLS